MLIDWSKVNEELHLQETKGLIKQSREKRKAMLLEIQTWPRGDLENYCLAVPSVIKGVNQQIYTPDEDYVPDKVGEVDLGKLQAQREKDIKAPPQSSLA